jgi:actin-like ATPase involved in cell morphogenesis
MDAVIGISLGDTYGCVAAPSAGGVVAIPNAAGDRTTPAMVAFPDTGEPLVGELAKRQAIVNARSTIYGMRRLMGQRHADHAARRNDRACPFGVLPSPDGAAWVEVRGKRCPPEQLAALILDRLRLAAEQHVGERVRQAVIGVPTWFTTPQCEAMRCAARTAGLAVLDLIPEPSAAVLAHEAARRPGAEPDARPRRIAVYDLGGSSFSVTLVERTRERVALLASAVDLRLGGRDFDERIVDYFAGRFLAEAVHDLRADPHSFQRLWEAAETVKRELSSDLSSTINLPYISSDESGPRHVAAQLSRGELETLVDDLIERSLRACVATREAADLADLPIDEVVFVGGQTRMPRLRERVAELFGCEPELALAPEEAVAVGAALQARRLWHPAAATPAAPAPHARAAAASAAAAAAVTPVATTGAESAPPGEDTAPGDGAPAPVGPPPVTDVPPVSGPPGIEAFRPPSALPRVAAEETFIPLPDPVPQRASLGVTEVCVPLDLDDRRASLVPACGWPFPSSTGTVTGVWVPPPAPAEQPRPSRRGLHYLALGAAVVAALVLALGLAFRPRPVAAPVPTVLPAAHATNRVPILVRVKPQHARVELDGVATTLPLPLLPRDGRIHTLRVSAPGFRPAEVPFEADDMQLLQVTLDPVPDANGSAP